jgi:hypothetical protein
MSKASASVSQRNERVGKEVVLFSKQMARKSTMYTMSAEEKKFKRFPMFFAFENF